MLSVRNRGHFLNVVGENLEVEIVYCLSIQRLPCVSRFLHARSPLYRPLLKAMWTTPVVVVLLHLSLYSSLFVSSETFLRRGRAIQVF